MISYLDKIGLEYFWEKIKSKLSTKVDKVDGKGLSTNDYTTVEKNKLAGIAEGAEVNVLSDWNATSGDAVILNKPNIKVDSINSKGVNISNDRIITRGLYVSISDSRNSIELDHGGDAGILIIANDGSDGTITLSASSKIDINTTGTNKAYYNNKEIATVDQIVAPPVTSVNGMTGAVVIETKLSSGYQMSSAENDDLQLTANDTYETAFGKLEKEVNDNSLIVSTALTDLNDRINDTKSDLANKQDTITDLATIRSNAAAGAAKISNVQTDWNATSGLAQILNKPTIPTKITQLTDGSSNNIDGILHADSISSISLEQFYAHATPEHYLASIPAVRELINLDITVDQRADSTFAGTKIKGTAVVTGTYNASTSSYEAPTWYVLYNLPAYNITPSDISNWNSKSNFSGSYNDLSDKPTIPTNYAGSPEAGGTANKTASIPYAQVDSTSTATVFTATVDGITELRDGVCCLLKNGVVTSASGFTLNVNNLGAKPCYTNLAAATRDTTIFNIDYTMLFVYDSTRVDGGGWICYRGYDSNTDTVGYNIREYSNGGKKLKTAMQRYQLVMTTMDDMLLPVYSGSYTTATNKVLTTESFNPFGQIYYYGTTTTIAADGTPANIVLYVQATYSTLVDLRYSFNTGTTLTAGDDIYLVCVPQSDGSVKLHTDPIAKSLPTTEDGLVYKRLGKAYDNYKIILELDKPCYYYKDGAVRLWTNQHEVNLLLNVTYSQLVTLRNNSLLVPGLQYRITDYVTTTVQEHTQSAGHLFDVIVTADSTNTLNENARAAKHDGDTYFADSNLAAWLIKYTLDNDNDKFLWADTTNGKGVIYWMKDEWENECPYDFKNILFRRYQCTDTNEPFYGEYVISVAVNGSNCPNYDYNDSSYKFYYTFSKESDSIIDFSLGSEGECVLNRIQRMGEYIVLLDNVFIVRDAIYNNTFSSADMNTFICGVICENVFGDYLYGNLIRTGGRLGSGVMNNTVGACFQSNVVYTTSNSLNKGSMMYNNIGNNFSNNYMTAGFVRNTIGNGFDGNATSGLLEGNSIGNTVTNNIFSGVINGNKIGNNCIRAEFNNVYFSEIGTYCQHIKFLKPYVYYTIIEPGNQYINITSDLSTSSSNKIQNIKICQGYNNSVTVRTITVPVVNNAYLIEYKSANSVVYN